MTDKLPPLPEPVGAFYVNEGSGVWTQYRRAPRPLTDGDAEFFDAGQMRAYATAARAQALEDAANVCEDQNQEYEPYTGQPKNLAYQCAAAIRAMKGTP